MIKDMKLKRGDIVYTVNKYGFEARGTILNEWSGKSIKNFENNTERKILKIERPLTVYEVKEVLDKKEREYLSKIIEPFKKRVIRIEKVKALYYDDSEFINIVLYSPVIYASEENIPLPYFKKGKMYKGMELNKQYSLKELGLD